MEANINLKIYRAVPPLPGHHCQYFTMFSSHTWNPLGKTCHTPCPSHGGGGGEVSTGHQVLQDTGTCPAVYLVSPARVQHSCAFALKFYFIEIQFIQHKIHHLHYFKVFNPVVFRIVTMLWDHHNYLIPKHVHHTPKKRTAGALLPLSLSSTLLLSAPVECSECPRKWTHATRGLLCLTSLTLRGVPKVHPHCSGCQCFTSFHG